LLPIEAGTDNPPHVRLAGLKRPILRPTEEKPRPRPPIPDLEKPQMARLVELVGDYCKKYAITPSFRVSEIVDLTTQYHDYFPYHDSPGCYAIYSEEEGLLYIGKANCLSSRLYAHIGGYPNYSSRQWLEEWGWSAVPRFIQTVEVNETYEALSLEAFLIGRLNPPDNVAGRTL